MPRMSRRALLCLAISVYCLLVLPRMFFVILPMTSWAFSNNILENTMTFFIVMAVYCCIVGLNHPNVLLSLLYEILSGVCIFLAFLVKGPVALFPLAVPFISMINE